MKILYINSCVRDNSRTNILANYLLSKLDGDIKEIKLNTESIKPYTSELLNKRDELVSKSKFDDELFKYANDFKDADTIVISSPYWDLSFSSLLKVYFENINVVGLTFNYENGMPYSLCKVKKVYYITTSGGYIKSDEYGFGYVKVLFNNFYNVNDIEYIKAEGLDIFGNDVDIIMNNAKISIDNLK